LGNRQKTLGPNHQETSQSYNFLGLLYYCLGDYPKAKEQMEMVLNIRKNWVKRENETEDCLVTIYSNLGIIENASNDNEKACTYLKHAFEIDSKGRTMRTAFVLLNLTNIQISKALSEKSKSAIQDFHESVRYAREYLADYKSLIDSKKMIGRFFYGVYYNTLGIIQDMASDTDTEVIVKSFEKAYRKIKMIFSESNYFIGVVLNNLGYAHLKKGNVGKCQKYLKKKSRKLS